MNRKLSKCAKKPKDILNILLPIWYLNRKSPNGPNLLTTSSIGKVSSRFTTNDSTKALNKSLQIRKIVIM